MKRTLTAAALFCVLAGFAAMPMLSNAAGPVAGTCTKPTPRPTPPAGSQSTSFAPADASGRGWLWHDSANTKAQAGGNGGHGYIVADADTTNKKASVKGYSTDQGNVNGNADVNQTSPSACAGVNNQKVAAAPLSNGSCTKPSPRPSPPAGAQKQSFAPADPTGQGWVWHDSANTKAQLGANGGHGYITAGADSTSQSASVKGYSTDASNGYGNANGDVQANKTAPSVCYGANGQKVTVS
jgi:hypothetical protein